MAQYHRTTMIRAVALCVLSLSLLGCRQEQESSASAPSNGDVVLAVSEGTRVTITRAEIDLVAKTLEFAELDKSPLHYRRLALREVILPRAAIRAANAEARATALARAEQIALELEDGKPHPEEQVSRGDLDLFGPLLIGTMLSLRGSEWSQRIENLGAFQFVRIVEPATPEVKFATLAIINIPYGRELTQYQDIERYLDRAVLEVMDPEYGDLIPTRIAHMMAPEGE